MISTHARQAQIRLEEISETLTAKDFSNYTYVFARTESGEQYFFPNAIAKFWVDPESGMSFWFIFPEHAQPIWVLEENGAVCLQLERIHIAETT